MSPTVQAKVCARADAFAQRAPTPLYAGGEREAEVNAHIVAVRETRRRQMAINPDRVDRAA